MNVIRFSKIESMLIERSLKIGFETNLTFKSFMSLEIKLTVFTILKKFLV